MNVLHVQVKGDIKMSIDCKLCCSVSIHGFFYCPQCHTQFCIACKEKVGRCPYCRYMFNFDLHQQVCRELYYDGNDEMMLIDDTDDFNDIIQEYQMPPILTRQFAYIYQ